VPLLFWQCANDVTPIDQAKRFYPLFAIFGNMAPIVSGQTTAYISKVRACVHTHLVQMPDHGRR
jgi:ATP:ADP antiporter, AAA family